MIVAEWGGSENILGIVDLQNTEGNFTSMLVYESCFVHIPQHLVPDSLVSHSYIHQAPSGTGRREG